MAFWSDLAVDIRAYRHGPLSLPVSNELKERLLTIKARLNSINMAIQKVVETEEPIILVEAMREDHMFSKVYNFKDYDFALLLTSQDGYALIIDRMIDIVDPSNTTPDSQQLEVWDSQVSRVRRICQSYEFFWKRRPMGAQHMSIPLTAAFSYAETDEMRNWIVQALNELDEHRMPGSRRFTPFTVSYLAGMYTGENEAFSPPSL
jgi:hypothetical protein